MSRRSSHTSASTFQPHNQGRGLGNSFCPCDHHQDGIHRSRCRDSGVKEDLCLYTQHALPKNSTPSLQRMSNVFGLPINLARKLLEMLLYRDLIQESNKRKSRLLNRKGGFLLKKILRRQSATEKTRYLIRCLN